MIRFLLSFSIGIIIGSIVFKLQEHYAFPNSLAYTLILSGAALWAIGLLLYDTYTSN